MTLILPYWLEQMIAAVPLALWVYLGLGIPWALVALPRRDWSDKPLVLCVALAFGPALLTAWMFIPATIGAALDTPLLRFDLLFTGTLIIAAAGTLLAWHKMTTTDAPHRESLPFAIDEKVIIGIIGVALLIRWLVVAYWPFTAYDALWVYGYQGRLYTLTGFIPQDIGYYPQFLPLQYTFMQLGVGGIDDHAARAVIPLLQIGSIMAIYSLGKRLFWRRVGIVAAAMWALYPHVGSWSHTGDLEIPLTFLFTATATFFLMAWHQPERPIRRRYALIAGLIFGIAMWTKPTAGAFVWGVVLLICLDLIRKQFDWHAWYPRFEVAAITGLACIPLGAIWYIRNISLGLPAIVFPPDTWLTLATRSGDLFGWLLLAGGLLLMYLAWRGTLRYPFVALVGTCLVLTGLLPSMPLLNPTRINPPDTYITLTEALFALTGSALVMLSLWKSMTQRIRPYVYKIGWVLALALPYFVTWFYSYSYHYRLSFTIVPLLILLGAVVIAHWLPAKTVTGWQANFKRLYAVCLVALAVPLVLVPIVSIDRHHDWLWTNRYPDDWTKYGLQNPSVVLTAEHLLGYVHDTGQQPVVVAPGEQRLHFFLPAATFITDTLPTDYDELAGATHFVYGTHARWRYEKDNGISPLDNRIVASLGRDDVMTRIITHDEGTFRYELYELSLDARYRELDMDIVGNIAEDEIIFGDFARYGGDALSTRNFAGQTLYLKLAWQALSAAADDYHVRFDLVYEPTNTVYATWEAPVMPSPHSYYNTELWEAGELIVDRRRFDVTTTPDMPRGGGYRLYLNFFDPATGETVPVYRNGNRLERGYKLDDPLNNG